MKTIRRLLFLALLCLFAVGAISVSAQTTNQDVFAVNYQLVRVLQSSFGYRVVYRTADLVEKEFYVPTRWIFSDKIALVSFSRSTAAPLLQAYFSNNDEKLQFFRLVLPRNPHHPTWVHDIEEGLEERFQNASLNSL